MKSTAARVKRLKRLNRDLVNLDKKYGKWFKLSYTTWEFFPIPDRVLVRMNVNIEERSRKRVKS